MTYVKVSKSCEGSEEYQEQNCRHRERFRGDLRIVEALAISRFQLAAEIGNWAKHKILP